MRIAALAREGLDAERAQQRQQEERARREESRLKSELKQYRRAFQSDTFSAPFGNTTVVGAPVPQNVDEFGADAGIDLTRIGARSSGTQTSPSIVAVQGARAALRGALQGQSIGGDDTPVLANQIRSPTVGRTLDFGESMIAGTPSPVVPSPYDFDLNDVTPPPDASVAGFSPGIQALAGFVRRVGVELDATGTPMSAAEVTHGAALDPVGDADSGNLAASGTDRDSTSHMDDILNALREITQLLQVTAGAQLVAQSQPVAQGSRLEFRRGFEPPEPHRGSDPSASDRLGELRARLDEIEQQFGRASEQYQTALAAYVEAVEDDIDSDEERPSNVTGLETESDDDFADMPTTPPAARDLAELLDAPAPAPAPAQPKACADCAAEMMRGAGHGGRIPDFSGTDMKFYKALCPLSPGVNNPGCAAQCPQRPSTGGSPATPARVDSVRHAVCLVPQPPAAPEELKRSPADLTFQARGVHPLSIYMSVWYRCTVLRTGSMAH